MDVFSWNLALGVPWVIALFVGGFFISFVLCIGFAAKAKDVHPIFAILIFLVMIGAPMGLMLFGPLMGRTDHILVSNQTPPIVEARFYSNGKGGRTITYRTFNAQTGERLGRLRLTSGFSRGRRKLSNGSIDLVKYGEDYELLDWKTKKKIGTIEALVKEKVGEGSFRITTIKRGNVLLEFQDGRTQSIPISTLSPQAIPISKPVSLMNSGCKTHHRPRHQKKKKTRFPKVLRASYVMIDNKTPCMLGGFDAHVTLVSHRSTAFGEGDYLLSAINLDTGKLLWTQNVKAWISSAEQYSLHMVSSDKASISFWLLRDKRSLMRMKLDIKTGKVLKYNVVF